MKTLGGNTKGFTLIEVAIATGIFAMLIVFMVSMGAQSSIFAKRIDQTYRSSFISQVQINSMKMLDYGNLSSGEESNVRVNEFGEPDVNGYYIRTTEVDANYNGDSNLSKIKVSVNEVKVNMDGSIANPVVYMGNPVVFETLFVNADVSVSEDDDDEDEHNDSHDDDDNDGECDEHEDADNDGDCDDSHDAHDDHDDDHDDDHEGHSDNEDEDHCDDDHEDDDHDD